MSLQSEFREREPTADEAVLSSRLNQFRDLQPTRGPRPIEREGLQPAWPGDQLIPEVPGSFSADQLRSAIACRGALIVRGLFKPQECEFLRDIIDHVVDACDVDQKPESTPRDIYWNPATALADLITESTLGYSRGFHRDSGSAMCVEAASAAEQILGLYEDKGLKPLLSDYLGEEPCLSALKWVLRRTKLPVTRAGWHQDGAFMGSEINSINMWVPMDKCGGATGAPGLDVVPVRMREVFKPGAEGAIFDWSISEDDIREAFGEDAVASPVFEPGDAFFFDHFYLHRTQYRQDFTRSRYALETWFFGNRNFAPNQVPLAW